MRKYISWRRVSTNHQKKSGLGLEAQKSIIEYFANQDGEIIADYAEAYSGTKLEECKELNKAIAHCNEVGATLIIAKTNRFRNTAEALSIYEKMDGNIVFCDLPNTDKFTLTLFFALAEREALMIKIQTKAGLQVIKDKFARGEVHVSKSGNVIHSLGRQGAPDRACTEAAARKRTADREEWYQSSPLIEQVKLMLSKGYSASEIIEMCGDLYEKFPDMYCCRGGGKLTRSLFYRAKHWILTGEIPY